MKRELLESMGLDKDNIQKIMDENNADIEKQKKLTEKANADLDSVKGERDTLTGQLSDVQAKLKAFEGVDVEKLHGEIKTLTDGLTKAQQDHTAEIARIARQSENRDFFSGLKTPFVNDETREFYANKLDAALDDPKFKNKNRQEILDALTAGEDGKPKSGVYKEPENPNPILNQPPVGKIPEKPMRPATPLLI